MWRVPGSRVKQQRARAHSNAGRTFAVMRSCRYWCFDPGVSAHCHECVWPHMPARRCNRQVAVARVHVKVPQQVLHVPPDLVRQGLPSQGQRSSQQLAVSPWQLCTGLSAKLY